MTKLLQIYRWENDFCSHLYTSVEEKKKAELLMLGRIEFKRKNFWNVFKSHKDNMKQKKTQAWK